MEGNEQFARPLEGSVIGASQYELHRLPVALDERLILGPHLRRRLSGEDPPDLVDRHGDALHGGRGRHRFGLQLSSKTARPGSREGTPIVDLGAPAVQLPAEGLELLGFVGKEGHE